MTTITGPKDGGVAGTAREPLETSGTEMITERQEITSPKKKPRKVKITNNLLFVSGKAAADARDEDAVNGDRKPT